MICESKVNTIYEKEDLPLCYTAFTVTGFGDTPFEIVSRLIL